MRINQGNISNNCQLSVTICAIWPELKTAAHASLLPCLLWWHAVSQIWSTPHSLPTQVTRPGNRRGRDTSPTSQVTVGACASRINLPLMANSCRRLPHYPTRSSLQQTTCFRSKPSKKQRGPDYVSIQKHLRRKHTMCRPSSCLFLAAGSWASAGMGGCLFLTQQLALRWRCISAPNPLNTHIPALQLGLQQ